MHESTFVTFIGVLGSAIAGAFGGWDAAMTTLLICMGIDYVMGIIVAAVFKKSPKSKTGTLSSKASWKGLLRKGVTLLIVLIACRLDIVLGTKFIRDAVIIAYIASECISIIENAGLMGVPIPKALMTAIDVLKQKSEEEKDGKTE